MGDRYHGQIQRQREVAVSDWPTPIWWRKGSLVLGLRSLTDARWDHDQERSLTTILYLLSLTEMARAPFSLVDEINQVRTVGEISNMRPLTTCFRVWINVPNEQSTTNWLRRHVRLTADSKSKCQSLRLILTTCRRYFLITPKLLSGLDYHPKMKVLTVYNGEWMPDGSGAGDMMGLLQRYLAKNANKNQAVAAH